MTPSAANFHLYAPCNLHCRFCFAVFDDVPGQLSLSDQLRLVEVLAVAGVRKLTLVGGEPTLYRHLPEVLRAAKANRLTTCVVSNGARLEPLLAAHHSDLDWIGLSCDSASETTQAALERGRGDHVARTLRLANRCRNLGVRLKLNTVVTALNVEESLHELVRTVRPERWKVFQVLPVGGQNDGEVEPLLVTREQFAAFLARHSHLAAEGLDPIAEDNEAMRGSYAMIDPLGRFYGNATGRHVYSPPILDVGVEAALAAVAFSAAKFDARGGRYAW